MPTEKTCDVLRRIRRDFGHSLADVSRLLDGPWSIADVSRFERGEYYHNGNTFPLVVPADYLKAFGRVYGLDGWKELAPAEKIGPAQVHAAFLECFPDGPCVLSIPGE